MSFGEDAVRLARAAIVSEVTGDDIPEMRDPAFFEKGGAFVTLEEFPQRELRGCIGYPLPMFELGRTIEEAARSACHDPRFPDLTEEELDGIIIEVTVLTEPTVIANDGPEDLMDRIVIGRDGLMLELGGYRGLFLPQVPVEQGWDKLEYLTNLCYKAGLPGNAWQHPNAVIHSFRGMLWSETEPNGPVERRELIES